MDRYIGIISIAVVCAVVLLIGALRKKSEWLLNFLLRAVLGTIGIYFINQALLGMGVEVGVGINVLTVLTSGILGFPGVAALYGIGFYQLL
ncbi:pro-sigmaK processing inhibitor BofA family protein [Lachnospiraceae bacterium OttesenSCG-928-D06]|nr:pro-sigmaK processing inhibitor BofA family protein [Lachnospiraceae bacterium OttesenSCG-928-D06]